MKNTIIFSALIFLSLGYYGIAQNQPKEVQLKNNNQTESVQKEEVKRPWNSVCPVKGNPVEEDTPTVEYNGKVYGFCCPGCDTKFAKNPERFAKNLSEDGKKFIGKK